MPDYIARLCLVLVAAALWPHAALAQGTPLRVDELGWLAGCWAGTDSVRRSEEHWMKPAGGTMLGMSRTVARGRTVAYEFLQIRRKDDGGIYYVAHPSGQQETWFRLVSHTAEEMVFENPAHDFPQRIRYRRVNADSLVARIEGMSHGRMRATDFPMQRCRCD